MTTYAIIGDGATGTTAAFYIRRADPDGRILLYSDESTPAYYRAALTNYLMGELRPEQLFAVPPNFYSDYRVERFLTRVVGIDAAGKKLKLSDGQEHPFDRLLIGAGSRARTPPFAGADLGGVMTMRTMQDARFIMDEVQSGRLKRGVIVGGGILGLELVAGLRARKIDATYVIRGDRVMPGVLDQIASDLVLSRCRHFDVDVRTDEEVQEARAGKHGYFQTALLKNSGATVDGDLMVVAIGTDPNVEFLAGSGIDVNRGIPVDERMRTNVDGIFAGGDVVEVNDPRVGSMISLGLWEPARHHGRIAGINMTDGSALWKLPVPYNATRLYDLDLAAIGESIESPRDETELEFPQTGRKIVYKKLVFRENRLVGALLLGERKEHVRERGSKYRQLIASDIDVSDVRHELLDPLFDLGAWMDSLTPDSGRVGSGGPGGSRVDISRIMGRVGPSAHSGGSESPLPARDDTGQHARQSLSDLMRSPLRGQGPVASTPRRNAAPATSGIGEGLAQPALKLPDGSVRAIVEGRVALGRTPENDIVVDDTLASSQHAELRRSGADMLVGDLGSRNGTFVNEIAVALPRPLAHGDVIRIGSSSFTFVNQVLLPRPDTGPAGLPDEPLGHPDAGIELVATLSWDGGSVKLGRAPVNIGRDPIETEVTLPDKAVSWVHAEVSRHDDEHYLRDLGSRNGTFVNGELLAIPRVLRSGDIIHIGNTDLAFETTEDSTLPFATVAEDTPESGELTGLLGTNGPLLGIWFVLRAPTTRIGRRPDCEVAIGDPTVSRDHAVFERKNDRWTVRDAGSTNGTFLNEEKLGAETAAVQLDDRLRVGRIEFRLGALPTEVAPPPTAAQGRSTEDFPVGATTVMDASDLLGRDSAELEAPEAPGSDVPDGLEVEKGPGAGRSISLAALPLVLGRDDGSGIIGLGDDYISARHLEIRRGSEGLEAVDLNSRNGTWLDEVRLQPDRPQPISPGTKLRLGPLSVVVVEG